MLKGKMDVGFLLVFTSLASLALQAAYAIPPNLCSKFSPAKNKMFVDTFNTNFLTVSRGTNNTITGKITHSFGANNNPTADIRGSCNGTLLAFSWEKGKTFYGQFSGTLECSNGIYNIAGILATMNNVPVQINAMISEPSGKCPSS